MTYSLDSKLGDLLVDQRVIDILEIDICQVPARIPRSAWPEEWH